MAEMFGIGDMVWSCIDLCNDGTIPDMPADALLASAGARGVVVKTGTIQDHPEIGVYLVRFEDHEGVLGPPVGCLTEELTQDPELAASLKNGVSTDAEGDDAAEEVSASDATSDTSTTGTKDTTTDDAPAHNG
jgi:nitrogen fixation protein NifZ